MGFVGRERERELLGERLAAALGGAGQVVLIAGEPGVGKTRLAEEAAAHQAMPVPGHGGGQRLPLGCPGLVATLSGQARGPLTKREQEIATLVPQGLSNRQIAAAAHISERTVETHVQHILGKLGFTVRTQIATWIVQANIRTGHQ